MNHRSFDAVQTAELHVRRCEHCTVCTRVGKHVVTGNTLKLAHKCYVVFTVHFDNIQQFEHKF
jgi:hypothetical protein